MHRLLAFVAVTAVAVLAGCGGTIIDPGHRGLRFDPRNGGLQHEVLQPGYHPLHCGVFQSVCPRIEDFDVTYDTRREDIATVSTEGLTLNLRVAVIARPIMSELFQLDTEIGPRYYDEVIGPELRSTARAIFARETFVGIEKRTRDIENAIEAELRRRVAGKHVEISSVLVQAISYPPEIAAALKARVAAEQEAARVKAVREAEVARIRATAPPDDLLRLGALAQAAATCRDAAALSPDRAAPIVQECRAKIARDLALWLGEAP